jgi:hypothetical protein
MTKKNATETEFENGKLNWKIITNRNSENRNENVFLKNINFKTGYRNVKVFVNRN